MGDFSIPVLASLVYYDDWEMMRGVFVGGLSEILVPPYRFHPDDLLGINSCSGFGLHSMDF